MKSTALALLMVPLLLLGAAPALAGDDHDEAAGIRIHIAALLHEAKALKAEGRPDAADVLWKRAHELKERLEAHGRAPIPLTREQAERVLHGLEMGMESLEILKHEKEWKALERLADAVRARMKAPREEHPEIREARRQLELYRVALHGLREAELRDALARMEHAIHVLELNLEGRRDEEAQRIRREGPDRAERVELLRRAAKVWDGFGHEGKAQALRELAEQMAAPRRAERGGVGTRPSAAPENRKVHEQRRRLWKHALAAFREAEKRELVERTESILEVYAMALEGREGKEVPSAFLRQVPKAREQAELAAAASHLYAGWKKEDLAHALMALSHELSTRVAARQEGDAPDGNPFDRLHREIRRLHERIDRLEAVLRERERR